MKIIKLLTVAGSLVIASSLLAPIVANAGISLSGMNCEAANLTQALQGLGKSQAGVKNNNATQSFFVVCPLDWEVEAPVPPTDLAIIVTFPDSTGSVECTVRAQNTLGAYNATSITVSAGDGSVGATRGLSESAVNLAGGFNNTIVCALDPGEGIEIVAIF